MLHPNEFEALSQIPILMPRTSPTTRASALTTDALPYERGRQLPPTGYAMAKR